MLLILAILAFILVATAVKFGREGLTAKDS